MADKTGAGWLTMTALHGAALLFLAACGNTAPVGSPPSASVASAAPALASDAPAEVDRGLEAHIAGDYERALSHYRNALAIDPGNTFAHYNIGVIDQLHGRMTDAEENYRGALAGDPDYVPALFNLALVRTLAEDFDEAATLYERVVQLEPERAAAHLNLGLVLARLGKTAEAEASLQRAIELDPQLARPSLIPGSSP